jgi:hypothetical protein
MGGKPEIGSSSQARMLPPPEVPPPPPPPPLELPPPPFEPPLEPHQDAFLPLVPVSLVEVRPFFALFVAPVLRALLFVAMYCFSFQKSI